MKLSGLWTRKSSPKENTPSPSSPVSETTWMRLKSKLSNRSGNEPTDTPTLERTKALTDNPGDEPSREPNLINQPSSLRPMATPSPVPTLHRPSLDKELSPLPTGSSNSSPSSPPDSQPSNDLSQCHPVSCAAHRAGTPGETVSTECPVQSFDVEANVGEVVAPVPLPHTPTVPPSNDIRAIGQSEKPPARELSVAYTPESFGALFQQQNEDVSAMLSTAGLAQARRRRLRAATIRARRMAEDFAVTAFDLANLGAAFLAGPADDDDDDDASANHGVDMRLSAGDEADTSPADAPVFPNTPLHESSRESTTQFASSHETYCALESETVAPEFSFVNVNVLVPAGPAKDVADSKSSITDFNLINLGAAFLAGSADDDDNEAYVNNEGDTILSASNEVEASYAVAPNTSNPPLHETHGEPTIQITLSDVQATTEPSETNQPTESDEGDLSGLYWQFRDTWASPAPLSSLVEEDGTFFSPLPRGETTGEASEINDATESESIELKFSLPYLNVLVPAGSPDSEGDRTPSAGDEVDTLSVVAPGPPNSPSHENSCEPTTQAASADPQASTELPKTNYPVESDAVDPSGPCSPCRDSWESSAPLISLPELDSFFSPLLRGELDIAAFSGNGQPNVNSTDGERVAPESSSYDPTLQSISIADADNRSPAGSAKIDARFVQRERETSAEDEAQSSSSVAPPQPTAVWHMEPAGIIIQLTPPSPRNSIEPSQSNLIAQRRAMRRYNSHRKPTDRQTSSSPATSDGPGSFGHQADRLIVPPFRKRRSRHRKTTESSQPEDVVARPSPPNAETVPTSAYLGDSVKRCSPATPPLPVSPSRPAESGRRTIDTGMKLSAVSEAAPSSSAAPIRSPAVLRKKPKKVIKVSERLALSPARQQPRSLTSRITSSLRGWGAAALRLVPVPRSATVEGSEVANPSFDPWEGFVPPRGPSPETAPGDDLAPTQSEIWNIYVKVD